VAKVIEERLKERDGYSRSKRFFCVSQKLGKVTAILFGSYARGDFNVWSDMDVLIVAENLPQNPLERLSLIDKCLASPPRAELIPITVKEFVKMRNRNLVIVKATERGIALLDLLNLISTT
jgi:hypothetical protein